MAEFISKFGHKTFRANQLLRWIYKDYVHQFDVMSDIAKDFRQALSDHASIIAPI
jgi:23S rRNA (adenine2503-C2)-methyltransferase